MKITPIKQRDEEDCGPASIGMALNYLKVPCSIKELTEISDYVKKEGLTDDDLVETLKSFPVNIQESVNTSWDDLMNLNTKDSVIIVAWMKLGYIGHFSVVESVGEEYIEIIDPEEGGLAKMEKMVFMRLWMGYDDLWYPEVNTDIKLRWMCVVSKK